MADEIVPLPFNNASGGLLADENIKSMPGNYAQTPKYTTDSATTDRMARFFISDSLEAALNKYYSQVSGGNALISALKNKGFFDFFLTGISDSSQDRYQLTETMGQNYVLYGFNSAPEILTCTGVLKNTREDDWRVQFLEFFKKIGGISSLAKFYNFGNSNVSNYLSFKYDSVIKRGALLNVSHSLTANNEMDIPFSFSYIVLKTIPFIQTNGNLININTGDEAGIIDGEISAVRQITSSGLRTLVPADSKNNMAVDKVIAQTVKQKVTTGELDASGSGVLSRG